MSQSYVSLFRDGGGCRVEYLLHVGGYPWAVCTHPDLVSALSSPSTDVTADAARSNMFGSLSWSVVGIGTVYPRRHVNVFPLLDFDSLGKQEYRSEVSKGILTGGGWSCDVFDDDIQFSHDYTTIPSDQYRGLDGLQRVAVPNGSTPTVAFAKLANPLKRYGPSSTNITTLSFSDISNGLLMADAARDADSYNYMPIWVNHECIGIYSTAGSNAIDVTATIAGAGAARGLFKSRRQDHFTSGLYGKNPYVSSSPGSIAGKFAWLYAIPMTTDGEIMLDGSGNPLVAVERCGIVAPDVKTQGGKTHISINPPLSAGKASVQPYKKTMSSTHFAGYSFSRGNSGTSVESILKHRQKPHLILYERNDTTKTWQYIRPVWICARNSYVHFNTIEEVRAALRTELSLIAAGSSDQLSGDGSDADNTPVQTLYDWSLDVPFATSSGSRWRPMADGPLPWILGGASLTRTGTALEFPGRLYHEEGTSIFELVGESMFRPESWALPWVPISPSANPMGDNAVLPPASYYVGWDWTTDLIGEWSYSLGGTCPAPVKVSYFMPAVDKYYVQPTPDGILTVGEVYSFGKNSTSQPVMSGEISSTTPDTFSNIFTFDIDGGRFETINGDNKFVYGASLYDNPALTIWDEIYEMSDNDKKQAILNYDFATNDRCKISTIDTVPAVANPSALMRVLMGDRSISVTVSGTNQNTWCPFFVTEGDFFSMIDWDSMDETFQKIDSSQYYFLPDSDAEDTKTFYDILRMETLYHRCRMTYEFDEELMMWRYKFAAVGPANRSLASVSGMHLTDDVLTSPSIAETHSVDKKYDSITVLVNRMEKNQYQATAKIEGVNVSGVLPDTSNLKIEPYLSKLTIGTGSLTDQSLGGGSPFSQSIYNGFAGAFMTALSSPSITLDAKLTCAAKFSAPIGRSLLFSFSGARTPYTHDYGLDHEPGFVTKYGYDISKATCSISFEIGGEFIDTIAPACKLSAGDFTLTSTTIVGSPEDHEFTDSGDMRDVFYFDCYSPGNNPSSPTERVCSCGDYSVLILHDSNSWSPITGTCSVSASGVITITVSSTATMSTAEDYYIVFGNYSVIEDCQKKWIYKCDSDNSIVSDPASNWI